MMKLHNYLVFNPNNSTHKTPTNKRNNLSLFLLHKSMHLGERLLNEVSSMVQRISVLGRNNVAASLGAAWSIGALV